MRILIATDAWHPQVNGVVRTLGETARELEAMGHAVGFLTPLHFRTVPCPTYPEIRLSLAPQSFVRPQIEAFGPDAIHIATEGPIGLAARRYCLRRDLPFSTAYHTRFPEYVEARTGSTLVRKLVYRYMRWFHRPSRSIMVATKSMAETLRRHGFSNLREWCRGVDTELFKPHTDTEPPDPRPVYLYAGRVAVEKGIEEFLDLELDGTKLVIGDGPQLAELKARYPHVVFTGYKTGEDLARHMSLGDVFVFPSRTETFGVVMLEALACGVPVAAHPAPGPIDLINDPRIGALDEDLAVAVEKALSGDSAACRTYALGFSWAETARRFVSFLAPFDGRAASVRRTPVTS